MKFKKDEYIKLYFEQKTTEYSQCARSQRMLYRVQLYEQEPQYARLACGNACHQCAVCTMDIENKE